MPTAERPEPASADGSPSITTHGPTRHSPTARRWPCGVLARTANSPPPAVDMWITLTRCPQAHSDNSKTMLKRLERGTERQTPTKKPNQVVPLLGSTSGGVARGEHGCRSGGAPCGASEP